MFGVGEMECEHCGSELVRFGETQVVHCIKRDNRLLILEQVVCGFRLIVKNPILNCLPSQRHLLS